MNSTLGPTKLIINMAQRAPGGVISWYEARDEYLKGSAAARKDEVTASRKASRGSRSGNRQYHIALARVLKRNFSKVDGTDGFYVLKSSIVGEP